MTTTVAAPPAAAPASSAAKPEAVARVAPKPDFLDPDHVPKHKDAVDFLKARRAERLRLASSNGERVDQTSDEPASDATPEDPPVDGEGSSETEGDDLEDQEPEKMPTWAQKLRADLSEKTHTLHKLEQERTQRDQVFAQAHQQVKHALEDKGDENQHLASLVDSLRSVISRTFMKTADGRFVPATISDDSWSAIQSAREVEKLKRQLGRGQGAVQAQTHEKAGQEAVGQLEALRKEIPELDWEKNPEAKAWLQARFALDEQRRPMGAGMRNIKVDAIAFAKALRWDRQQMAQQKERQHTQPKPADGRRPSSSTLPGSGGGTVTKTTPQVPRNEKESLAWLAARRAARK